MNKHLILFAMMAMAVAGMCACDKDGVSLQKQRYDEASEYPGQLYIFRPAHVKGDLPCVVHIIGSSWKEQDMKLAEPRARKLAAMGYVVASMQYRPCSMALFPAQIEDSKTAVRFMRAHAKEYGVDTCNVFLWGGSSGAHTALMHAITQNGDQMDNGHLGEWSCKVNAVAEYYGPTELVKLFRLDQDPPGNPILGGGLLLGDPVDGKMAEAIAASPLYYVNPDMPPVLVAHGDSDTVVPVEQGTLLIEQLEANGVTHEAYILPGDDHGTDGFWTAEMYGRLDAFFKKYSVSK